MIQINLYHQKLVQLLQPAYFQICFDVPVRFLAWDTRSLPERLPEQVMFVAFRGPHYDGHDYVFEAYQKGVRNFLLEKNVFDHTFTDINHFIVADTVRALQKIASYYRSRFDFPIIAITGSNGKTVVKEWLYQVLSGLTAKPVFRSPASYNSQIGVPFSVLMASEKSYAYGIFEAGISKPGEMQHLQQILKPQLGIFTNLGIAHQANFASLNEKAQEKALLFKEAHQIVYASTSDIVGQAFDYHHIRKDRRISWGYSDKDNFFVRNIIIEGSKSFVYLKHEQKDYLLVIPFVDHGSIENVLHIYVLLRTLGFSHQNLQEQILKLEPVEMRLEVKDGRNNCIIINDAYNSDLNSLTIAFDALSRFENKKKTVIISDVLQTGIKPKEYELFLLKQIEKVKPNRLIAIGEQLKQFQPGNFCRFEHYPTTDDFLMKIQRNSFQNEVILLKGARSFGFERISTLLEDKLHKTKLEINLQALAHNLEVIRKKLPPGTRIMAMMKAFAYGGGSIEIARFLSRRNVHYLAVAYTDEGIELREAGINLPIMVMEPAENDFFDILMYKMEMEIYDFHILNALLGFIKRHEVDLATSIPIHIKVDTGMHRLGFTLEQIPHLLKLLTSHSQLKVVSVFTHLSAADDPHHDDFTRQQLSLFLSMVSQMEKGLGYSFIKHIANSAAAVRFTDMSMDMVRLGISLLGQNLVKDIHSDLQPVLTLKAPIVQVKDIPPGDSVGYNRRAIANHARRIAILSIGYADGLNRLLGNERWKVYLHGQEAKIIGDICMDMTFVDITHIPQVRVGDEVEIFGPHRPVTEMASILNTIPYEIFTSIGRRVNRVYIE